MSKQALVGSFLVSGVGKGIGVVIGVATIGVLTRYLGSDGYGGYMLAFAFLTILTTIANFGFPIAQLHMMGHGDIDEGRVVNGFAGLRLVVGTTCLMLAPAIVLLFDYSARVRELVWIGTLAFFFSYMSGALGPVFQKHLVMGRSALALLANRLVFLLLVSLCMFFDLGARAVMLSLAAATATAFFMQLWLLRPIVSPRPRIEAQVWRTAWQIGWPASILSVLGLLSMHGDILLLGVYHEEQLGVYGLPFRIVMLVMSLVPTAFMGLMLPQLTRMWHDDDEAEFRDHLQTAFNMLLLALLPIVVATMARAEGLIALLSGNPEFAAGADVLRIHILAVAGLFFSMLYRHAGIAVGRQRNLIAPTGVATLATLAVYVIFVPTYGMYGAAWGRVFHAAFDVVVTFATVYPTIRHVPRFGFAGRAILSGGAMFAALRWLPPVNVVFDLALAMVVYGLALLATGAIRPSQIRDILASLRS